MNQQGPEVGIIKSPFGNFLRVLIGVAEKAGSQRINNRLDEVLHIQVFLIAVAGEVEAEAEADGEIARMDSTPRPPASP